MTIGSIRTIVCVNHAEAAKDAADRAAILDSLARQLKKGDTALVGNTGYRRFLTREDRGRFAINAHKVAADAKFDGVFVLRADFSDSGQRFQ